MEVKEASARYPANRYRQTEVGTIPEDWNVMRFGEIALPLGQRIDPRKSGVQDFCVELEHIGSATGSLFGSTNTDAQSSLKSVFRTGDVLFGKLRAYLRKYWRADRPGVCSTEIWVLSPIEPLFSSAYLFQLVQTDKFAEAASSSYGTHMPRSDWNVVKNYALPLPPTKAEQDAIAEALSDADALIESLGQLLAKKRLIKQGVIQELLCEKEGDVVRLLREVSSLKGRIGWQGLKQIEFTSNKDEPFLITGMNFKDGAIRWNEVYHISEVRYEVAPEIQLRPQDVLMTKDGTIGKVLYIDTIPYPGKASLNSHLLLFRPIRDSYNPKYLYFQLGSWRFQDFIELSKSGTTFFGLSQAAVGNYPVLLPPMHEQIRIAAILSDMDAEIAALEEKLAKASAIKTGMMQELLTGRIRLI